MKSGWGHSTALRVPSGLSQPVVPSLVSWHKRKQARGLPNYANCFASCPLSSLLLRLRQANGAERRQDYFPVLESYRQPPPSCFSVHVLSVPDCPDGDFLLFDFIDDSVITNPNLPKSSERLTQPDPISCRLCRKPTVNGPNDPGANVRWKLRQVLCHYIWAQSDFVSQVALLDSESPLDLSQRNGFP
jgi:hypothetical protein